MKLSKLITELADLPGESLPGQPLLELYGDDRVLIENHKGILEYGSQLIRVKMQYGALCVKGSDLHLRRMQDKQLVIMGCIGAVELERGKGT